MDEQRHHAAASRSPRAILLGAHAPFDHRVHELEVARVEGEREVNFVARRGAVIGRVAEVVLDVAAAEVLFGIAVFERREDLAHVLVHDVGEDVEPPAVRHAEDNLFDPLLAGGLDQQVEQRDHALGALEREALGPDVVLVDELLEDLGVGELGEDAELLFAAELEPVLRRLHPLLQPEALFGIFEVRELDADRAAVGRPRDAR